MRRFRIALGLSTLLGFSLMIAACSGPEKNEDYADMNKISMQTVCLGRMLVDMPQGKLNWQQQFDYGNKVTLLRKSVDTEDKFWRFIDQHKNELDRPTTDGPDDLLNQYEKISHNKVFFEYDSEVAPDRVSHVEHYLWADDHGYKFSPVTVQKKGIQALLSRIKNTSDQVRSIKNAEPPNKPGFCIDSGLVTGRIGPISTNASTEVKRWKGVRVSVGTSEDDGTREPLPWQKDKKALSSRTPFENLDARKSHTPDNQESFTVIRRQKKELGGMSGEEMAFKVSLDNGQKYYKFVWRTIDKESSPSKTGFGFQLSAGADYSTTNYHEPPDEDDLLALWDTMLASLKNRPDAR